MSQKLDRYPILTIITKIPGTVNPSNKPNIQKNIEPIERYKKFLRMTPED